jgi:hypothetical protein
MTVDVMDWLKLSFEYNVESLHRFIIHFLRVNAMAMSSDNWASIMKKYAQL